MSVTFASLRQQTAARVALIGGTWWEAPVPYEHFGPAAVPDSIPATKGHLAFAVGLTQTERGDDGTRGRASDGLLVDTIVGVRFLARHTPGPTNSLTSQDAALAAELALIRQLMGRTATAPAWPNEIKVRFDRTDTRTLNESGEWFTTTVLFRMMHVLPLA